MNISDAITHIAKFISGVWQIHAFGEGNTRTTAVFTIKYLRTFGFDISNEAFANHSWYFRNALVRANYSNLQEGITETTVFLERFFRNMLLGETTPLRNREMHLDWKGETENQRAKIESKNEEGTVQREKSALPLPQKCKNCTLEEIAVLRIIQQEPSAKQTFIAQEIKKSERTVKTITARLTEKGIIKRSKGKGSDWVMIYD